MHRLTETAALAAALALACTACAGIPWERGFYEGLRQGNDQAARRSGAAAVPQTTPLPAYDRYERERQRLRSAEASSPDAAASAVQR
ncbi:MAG TPA: hypothetical protein VFR90_06750 [Methylibium sp.]|uniref:hypothetical protein n=1 Tax=Methylibium sp. TaxID=2067992 RepID=UPI002DB8A85E|nr:hypothetical protein [Methylibium sp.]HEU4458805.1 hypothetical protein [Methylibium sp.]